MLGKPEAPTPARVAELETRLSRDLDIRLSKHYATVHIPPLFKIAEHIDNLGWIKKKNPKAVAACATFVADYGEPLARAQRPPLLVGPSGTGKTHLLYATAAGIASKINLNNSKARGRIEEEEGRRIRSTGNYELQDGDAAGLRYAKIELVQGAEIAHDLRMSITKNNLDSVIDRYRQSAGRAMIPGAILFVDDVEVMKMGDWLNEELYRIFDFRYAYQVPTVLATNLGLDELRGHLGDRITRRLVDMTEPIVLK